MLPRPWRVIEARRELGDTASLVIAPVDAPPDAPPPAFAPGQFNMLYAFGVGEAAISISAATAAGVVHTIRGVGATSRALAALRRGDVLGVRGPYGRGWPMEAPAGSDLVFVAGGLGLAPLRPAIHAALARRERWGRVLLLYGARGPGELLWRDEIASWRGAVDVMLTVDHAEAGWDGAVGVVPALLPRARFDPASAIAMVCGPELMMRFTVIELQKRGIGPESICLSMERNMKCAVGFCGHCQFGPFFVCKDGPVFRYDRIQAFFGKREI